MVKLAIYLLFMSTGFEFQFLVTLLVLVNHFKLYDSRVPVSNCLFLSRLYLFREWSLYSLCVCCSNVVDRGLSDDIALPASDAFDSVTCSLVTDIDFDGIQEIVLGTYGQVRLWDSL